MITVEEKERFLGKNERSTQAGELAVLELERNATRKRREKEEKKKRGGKKKRKQKLAKTQTNIGSESAENGKPWKDDSLLAGWSRFQHILNDDRDSKRKDIVYIPGELLTA